MSNKENIDSTIWYEEGHYQIIDLLKDRYDEALDYLEKHYIPNKIIFQNVLSIGDNDDFETKCTEIKNEFRQILKNLMDDNLSLVVIDTKNDKIIAVMVNVMMTKEMQSWDLWTVFVEDPVLEALFELERLLVNKSIEKLGIESPRDSLHAFILCLSPEFKGNNWKIKLLMSAAKLAKDLELPYLTYIGYSKNDHHRALKIGMKEVGSFTISEFESCDSVMHLDWLPKNYNEAIYHELDLEKLPEVRESALKLAESDIQFNQDTQLKI